MTAISQLDDAYTQNGRDIQTYIETIDKGQLYTMRGYRLSAQEKIVREVVETLMCNYALHWPTIANHLSLSVDEVQKACGYNRTYMQEMAADGLLKLNDERIIVSTEGRPFVRCVAAALDPLMRHTNKSFSKPI